MKLACIGLCLGSALASAQFPTGYYRQPSLRGDTIVFVSEGDLWRVSADKAKTSAVASRLTSHTGAETSPRLSPDGSRIAFVAEYEGPGEVYIMPTTGGTPRRLTFDGGARAGAVGWTNETPPRIIAATTRFSTLPSTQLALINPEAPGRELVSLAQAAEGAYDEAGTLYFTRLPPQGSQTKRYKGGTAQQLWSFSLGAAEAVHLTPDFVGSNTTPMWWRGRLYFLSDRDGTMEVWSMLPDGGDVRQETNHTQPGTELLDVKGASLDAGRIVYQLGADLWLHDLATATGTKLTISLDSDFGQTVERWVKKPMDFLTAAHISHDGERIVLTARGQVFVAPRQQGRLVEASRKDGVRYRAARFMPDGKSLITLSDESGEVELWTLPANGVGERAQLTGNSEILRWDTLPSPDGNWIAHHDKNQRLYLFDVRTKTDSRIDENPWENFADPVWSPDSRYLAYTVTADNQNPIIRIHDTKTGTKTDATTDRFASFSPSWSPDGKWLYFISERHLRSLVGSPWGLMAPEPYFDNKCKVYAVALTSGQRWPFLPDDELMPKKDGDKDSKQQDKKDTDKADPVKKEGDAQPGQDTPAAGAGTVGAGGEATSSKNGSKKKPDPIEIEFAGLAERLHEVPAPPGNYSGLFVTDKRLILFSSSNAADGKNNLVVYPIGNKDLELKTLVPDIRSYEPSGDGKWLLIRKGDAFHVIESSAGAPASLEKSAVPLTNWSFPLDPREEWRQMFTEAWRLERDYFYDRSMHGVDWKAMLARYLPLVDRVATRAELNDLIAQMVAELSALHIFVRGGDQPRGDTDIAPATLGAILTRDEAAGGYRVESVYETDPDEPDRRPPLARPGVNIAAGDVIEAINGRPALSAPDAESLLRNQAGKQVLLTVKPKGGGESRDVIVTPISPGADADLRYSQWQYTRRKIVEEQGRGEIGYVHLRAMGGENFTEFAKGFYPVFNRRGLILDARHNRGGNIDSWILSRLLRKAWFYWQPRIGNPTWNMQFAFRGHVVVLCNELTASDGEALAEGIRRLGIGTIIGTRTWGGEIWLSSSNYLVDGGIATAAEIGVYGPEGEWLIEGHGVDPDIVVDNLPHATFKGEDAQLDAAIRHLQEKIKNDPRDVNPAPRHPDKSFRPGR